MNSSVLFHANVCRRLLFKEEIPPDEYKLRIEDVKDKQQSQSQAQNSISEFVDLNVPIPQTNNDTTNSFEPTKPPPSEQQNNLDNRFTSTEEGEEREVPSLEETKTTSQPFKTKYFPSFLKNDSQWFICTSEEQLNTLINSLDVKGIRECELRQQLEKLRPTIISHPLLLSFKKENHLSNNQPNEHNEKTNEIQNIDNEEEERIVEFEKVETKSNDLSKGKNVMM
jgi:hypothetical protein